jgi:hypothetical protein
MSVSRNAGSRQKFRVTSTTSPATAAARPAGVMYQANVRNAIASASAKRPPACRKKYA